MPDVYYNPEKFGLTIIGEANDLDASYSFDMFTVWRDEAGQLYYASDEGCSCPSPFEDYTSLDKLAKGTVPEVQAALMEWGGTDGSYRRTAASAAELYDKLAMIGRG